MDQITENEIKSKSSRIQINLCADYQDYTVVRLG